MQLVGGYGLYTRAKYRQPFCPPSTLRNMKLTCSRICSGSLMAPLPRIASWISRYNLLTRMRSMGRLSVSCDSSMNYWMKSPCSNSMNFLIPRIVLPIESRMRSLPSRLMDFLFTLSSISSNKLFNSIPMLRPS